MKLLSSNLLQSFIAVAIVFSLSSCNKTPTSPNTTPTAPAGKLEASVDGADWLSNIALQNVSIGGAGVVRVKTSNRTTITAFRENPGVDTTSITLTTTLLTTGTVSLGASTTNAGAYGSFDQSKIWGTLTPNAGTLTISKFDESTKLVSGTFSFTGINTSLSRKSVTNGSFTDVPFVDQ